jgi:N6-adenosine-specific RNA methylase IME4
MSGPYQIIYADPPWQYRDHANAGRRGACHKYDVMPLDRICQLPIHRIAAGNCLLALWWVPPMPREALLVVQAWGFNLKTMCGFTWVKETRSQQADLFGRYHFGLGHWTRGNAEHCLLATRGKPKRVNASVSQLVFAPLREHSRKPDEVADRLVRLMGDVPRVELFARGHKPGWDVWGNEAEGSIELMEVMI